MTRSRKLERCLALGGLCVIAVALLLVAWPRGAGRPPTVVLISIDSLRADHLSCYGYGRATSPGIDRLAGGGALFETVVSSSSWTLPAHAALFTGLPDRVHGCIDETRWLDGSRQTVAEAFKAAEYETVGFFSGPFLHPAFGLAQGFDTYHDCTSYSERTIEMLKKGELVHNPFQAAHEDITGPNVLRQLDRWLNAHPDSPAFIFIHLWDVHFDYIPPPPYDTMFDKDYAGTVDGRVDRLREKPPAWSRRDVEHFTALYDGEIAWTDHTVGKIMEQLDRAGRLEDGIVALTADHGEAFWEHGTHGHRFTLFEEEIRIPLLIRAPGVRAGQRIDTPAHITDVAPTLLELAGIGALAHASGRSFAGVLAGSATEFPPRELVSELHNRPENVHLLSVRTPTWKVIVDLETRASKVFDLGRDPDERSPADGGTARVSAEKAYVETVKRLQALAESLPPMGKRDTPPIAAMTEAQLRALGYLK